MPRSLGLGTHLAREGEAPRPGPAMGSFQLDDFAAGWIGGTASVIVGHPLDTVKTRLQAGANNGSTLSCVRALYRRESVFGFFKGMSFPLASIAIYNSVVFGVFSNTQRFLSQHHGREPEASPRRTLPDLLLASMVAGVVSVGLGAPMDLIKIRLQMQTQPFRAGAISWGTATPMDVVKSRLQADGVHLNKYKGVLDCIYQSYQNEGLKGWSQPSRASVCGPQVAAEGSFSRCRRSESPGERRPPAAPAVRLGGPQPFGWARNPSSPSCPGSAPELAAQPPRWKDAADHHPFQICTGTW
ncbi:solute carrier family 25 member 48 isoform X5 [Manis pentadactyla]|uniref:solute carrier family 25 member 48 isoform X5 n=1 Tax=Manis pentadactyla TaxID=143292 RepID=UPI00255C9BB2|nr:solute carrier family 25 member 48 isoform X5 [Manis pentadactyla]